MDKEGRERRAQKMREAWERESRGEVIPADPKLSFQPKDREELVGAYCRVSTPQESQVESFEIQQQYYKKYVERHPNWTLVDIYADEGISATSMKHRDDLNRLLADCRKKKVTFIITKSISRFFRNVVDCIATCRELKSLDPPVGVMFETEGINTLNETSELVLTVLAATAQGESDTKSSIIKWAIRNRFTQDIPRITDLYGYDRVGEDLRPNEDAPVVKAIFDMAVNGHTPTEICRVLKEKQIPSPKGNREWTQSTILYILSNEKYNGDVVMQKTIRVDLYTHKTIKNRGHLPKYILRDHHMPIVSKEQWILVQRIMGHLGLDLLLGEEIQEGTLAGLRPIKPIGGKINDGKDTIRYERLP